MHLVKSWMNVSCANTTLLACSICTNKCTDTSCTSHTGPLWTLSLWYLRWIFDTWEENIATEVSLCLENFIYIFSHSCLLCMTCWSKVYLCITCFGATHGGSLLWDHNCLVPVFLFLLTRSYLFGLVMRFYPVTVQRYLYMSHTRINIVESFQ